MTHKEAVAICDAHEAAMLVARGQDCEIEKAFGNNPGIARKLDADFYENVYTPEFQKALAEVK